MNYIQQNAIDLVIGLREMKWNQLEQEMLESVPDNFDCARPSDFGVDASDVGLWGMPTWVLEEQRRIALQKKALTFDGCALLYADIPAHLPQQIRNQMKQSIGAFYNV